MPKPLAVQLYTFRDTDAVRWHAGWAWIRQTLEVDRGDGLSRRRDGRRARAVTPVASAPRARGRRPCRSRARTRGPMPADLDRVRASRRRTLAELGSPRIIVSGERVRVGRRRSRRFADRLNAAAGDRRPATASTLGYHNHSAEMRRDRRASRSIDRLRRPGSTPRSASRSTSSGSVVGGAESGRASIRRPRATGSSRSIVKDGVDAASAATDAEPFVNVPVGAGRRRRAAPAVATADRHPGVAWLIVEFDHVDGPAGRRRSGGSCRVPRSSDGAGPRAGRRDAGAQARRASGSSAAATSPDLYLRGRRPAFR